jgi:hypothetical protein
MTSTTLNPSGERCENCRFFFQTEPNKELQRQTVCRRYPPTGIAMPGPGGQMVTMAFFPAITLTFWCGEWAPGELIVKQ